MDAARSPGLVLALALLLTACPGPPDDTGSDLDPNTVPLAGMCDLSVDYGGFVVQSAGDRTGVEGKVADGVVPQLVLEEIGNEGDCRLLRRNNPFCDPTCDRGQVCDFDGTCLPYPSNQDMGIVTIAGLSTAVEMEPVFPGNTYFDTALSDPPFEPGALVTLTVPGPGSEPIVLHGVGVEILSGLDPEWKINEGQDLVVNWAAPAEGSRAHVDLTVSIDQHGATPGLLTCSFEDDGEGTVPAAIIDQLISSGVTGFPTGTITRQTVDKADVLDGCMDFAVSNPVQMEVDVVGFTPCVNQNDCPDGLTCNIELQICE